MKKKLYIFLISFILIIAILIFAKWLIEQNKERTSIDDFNSIKELIEYDGHTYINTANSTEEDFSKDIFMKFNINAISDNGVLNQNIYEIVISHVAGKMQGTNFRMIDEEKGIIVRIKYTDNEVTTYTINNDSKYWEHLSTNYQIDNFKDTELTNFQITSQELIDIINNNWKAKNLNLGTRDSNSNYYDIYFDEGYKVRIINAEIYNIVFTQNYNNTVINSITTKDSQEQVKQILGEPTYQDDETQIIGYKGRYIYVFFGNDEISIYPIDKYNAEDSEKFGKLVSELNNTGDMNTFLNKLTDIYPDYTSFYRTNSYIRIEYPLRGFEVVMGAASENGLTIYDNFQGRITEDVSIDDLKNNKTVPANVYTKFNNNLVFISEQARVSQDQLNRLSYDDAAKIKTNSYIVYENENKYNFYSNDKSKVDSELILSNVSSMFSLNDTTFVYGIKNSGIYIYDAEHLRNEALIEGQGEYVITKVENNIIYYDDKQLQFENN